MTEVIKLKKLKKNFKGVASVDLERLTVRKGEIYGFLGPNGAGKTTTMKMILSLIEPTSGSIEVMNAPINKSNDYLKYIGSMIEEPSYYPNLTGYENLLVFQKMLGFKEENILKTLELVGLSEEKNRKKLVKAYSLGMKQRLALAFALVKEPQILLLDEPTNGLDPSGIHEIRELIIRLAKEAGLTIFISSHILSEIEQIADRVGIINHGRLVYEGEIEKINANNWVEIEGKFDIEKLKPLFGNRKVEYTAKLIKIWNTDNEQIANIVRSLVELDFPIFRVEHRKENLEDIFLELTKEL
ncbi:TPA: ATP-binding cassette domain-containing protein [Streptococcus suis]|uniref:ABC transporter ATP-binding protein n=1 Tax=Streptococcus suis TaxID=1307 RepID=UPI000462DB34|nr:ATP-binding cassette domain-containing protein [Streptococcus suis 10581]HEM5085941.1 ATP-binding cassette domain-containing protein [Streptococcus suis]HEM5324558.1 ATP-binding cassette domain-containing protein [Streptococcus suis]HEP1789394.1 ATP-binding cassette domain-containing protein [Streptococcus suis]HEP1812674.1 ATP-binding cassette domain-containing protein [Streptococcus suis]